jgi:hypothetical protein
MDLEITGLSQPLTSTDPNLSKWMHGISYSKLFVKFLVSPFFAKGTITMSYQSDSQYFLLSVLIH